jgi:mannosyltransferase OCH1-like enzyme
VNGINVAIPKIIHRTVPDKTTALMDFCWESVIRHTPDYVHMTHLDGDKYELVADVLPLCEQGAVKADLIRLEVLYQHGGVYLDSDVELFRSLDPLLSNKLFVCAEHDKFLINAIIGCEPKDPLILELLNAQAKIVRDGKMKYPYLIKGEDGQKYAFGPYVFTQVLTGKDSVTVLPARDFLTSAPDEENKDLESTAYGKHHYAGSWMYGQSGFKNSAGIKLKHWLRSVKHQIALRITPGRFR